MRLWHSRPGITLLGLVLGLTLVIALGTGISIVRAGNAGSTPATTDPRLIIQPTTTRLISQLPAGLVAVGSLSPTIPGKNSVRIDVRQHGHIAAGPISVTLTFTMLDMKMPPQRTELIAHSHYYTGTIDLPMFGRYRVDVRVTTVTSRYRGSLTLALPLPRL